MVRAVRPSRIVDLAVFALGEQAGSDGEPWVEAHDRLVAGGSAACRVVSHGVGTGGSASAARQAPVEGTALRGSHGAWVTRVSAPALGVEQWSGHPRGQRSALLCCWFPCSACLSCSERLPQRLETQERAGQRRLQAQDM